jgi:hypothetical protein
MAHVVNKREIWIITHNPPGGRILDSKFQLLSIDPVTACLKTLNLTRICCNCWWIIEWEWKIDRSCESKHLITTSEKLRRIGLFLHPGHFPRPGSNHITHAGSNFCTTIDTFHGSAQVSFHSPRDFIAGTLDATFCSKKYIAKGRTYTPLIGVQFWARGSSSFD